MRAEIILRNSNSKLTVGPLVDTVIYFIIYNILYIFYIITNNALLTKLPKNSCINIVRKPILFTVNMKYTNYIK